MAARPEDLTITPRQPDFDLDTAMRQHRYWLRNDPLLTHFINALQSTFPEGERFFIDSARDVSAALGEAQLSPRLRDDLRRFIRQEAWHGKEHERWGEALQAIGYPRMAVYDDQIRRLRLWSRKHISARNRLAMTVAAEHMTASIARLLLEKRPDLLDDAERPMRDLLAWHAFEETEHKSVCFDLYVAAGGGYIRRSLALLFEMLDIFIHVHMRHRYLLRTDGLWNWRTRWRLLRDIWGPTGIMGSLLPFLLRYLKPGFHPWETDERAAFRQRYGDLLDAVESQGRA